MIILGKLTVFQQAAIIALAAGALFALIMLLASRGSAAAPVVPHTCITPTPDALHGGFRSPYPSAPFCTGR